MDFEVAVAKDGLLLAEDRVHEGGRKLGDLGLVIVRQERGLVGGADCTRRVGARAGVRRAATAEGHEPSRGRGSVPSASLRQLRPSADHSLSIFEVVVGRVPMLAWFTSGAQAATVLVASEELPSHPLDLDPSSDTFATSSCLSNYYSLASR